MRSVRPCWRQLRVVSVDVQYQVTADDVAAGVINNTGTGDSVQTPPDSDPEVVPVPTPSMIIEKVATSVTNPDGTTSANIEVDEVGDVINYTITATNNGTANLTGVMVSDDLTGDFTGDGTHAACADPLLAAANNGGTAGTCVLTTSYTVTQADLDNNGINPTANGFIDNTGEADSVQTDPVDDSKEVPVIQLPAHTLTKTFDPDPVGVGENGAFTLVYTNTGNVTLSDIDITDTVQSLLVVESVDGGGATCSDADNNAQTIFCEVDSLAPGESVTITVNFLAVPLAEGLVPDTGQTSGANYVFYFANGYVLYGSTQAGTATLLDDGGNLVDVTTWSVVGRNQDIFFDAPYDGGSDGGFELHLSCSEVFIDGWGNTGPIEGEDGDDWNILAYEVLRFNNNGLFKDCGQTFAPFEVPNEASAMATPAGGNLTPNPITAFDSLTVINIAPIEVTRERFRRKDVEIQYFNTSQDDLEIDIIRLEWDDPSVLLEFASYQDGVDLGISGCDPTPDGCLLQASIDTILPDRSKDWLKMSFTPGVEPDGLTITIVTDGGATFTHEYGTL